MDSVGRRGRAPVDLDFDFFLFFFDAVFVFFTPKRQQGVGGRELDLAADAEFCGRRKESEREREKKRER